MKYIESMALVAILTAFIILTRIISAILSMYFIALKPERLSSMIYFIPCGPVSLIVLRRFMPGFASYMPENTSIMKMYSVLTTSMMLLFVVFTVLYAMLKMSNTVNIAVAYDTSEK